MARKRAGDRTRKRTSTASRAGSRAKTGRGRSARKAKASTSRGARAARATKKAPRKAAKKAPARTQRAAAKPSRSSVAKKAKGPVKAVAPKRERPIATAKPSHPKHPPALERTRRQLHEVEDNIPTPPSSLDLDRNPSAARSGRREMREARLQHNETSPELTGGDVDADWQDAYAVGDEAPGGDNPTPDQDRVDDIGKALGVQYDDTEELKTGDKISQRDRHRWELDPASAEDYPEHEE
jgi:hypothetical protein